MYRAIEREEERGLTDAVEHKKEKFGNKMITKVKEKLNDGFQKRTSQETDNDEFSNVKVQNMLFYKTEEIFMPNTDNEGGN